MCFRSKTYFLLDLILMVTFLIKCSNPLKVSLNLKSVSFFQREAVCSRRVAIPFLPHDAASVQMPDTFKVDLAPVLLFYPETALRHNGATVLKNPDGSFSPK